MGYSKSIAIGNAGSLNFSESAGNLSIAVNLSESVGGGIVAGALAGSASMSVTLKASQLVDVGLELAAAQFPSIAAEIAVAKSAIDAEMAKL